MNNKKKCDVIGYGTYNDKETNELKFRICMCVESENENYNGKVAVFAFLPYNEILENNLKRAIMDSEAKCYYTTTDNIITGKTKVAEIFVD